MSVLDRLTIHCPKYPDRMELVSAKYKVIRNMLATLCFKIVLKNSVHKANPFPKVPRGIIIPGAIRLIQSSGVIVTWVHDTH